MKVDSTSASIYTVTPQQMKISHGFIREHPLSKIMVIKIKPLNYNINNGL
jgi:hypothetical protein